MLSWQRNKRALTLLELCDLGQVTVVSSFVHEVMRRFKKMYGPVSSTLLLKTWSSLNIIKIIPNLMHWVVS